MIALKIFIIFILTVSSSPTCKDDNNKQVDWWIAYKLPSTHSGSNPAVVNGVGFAYMDSAQSKFVVSTKSMNDTSGTFISNTMNQIYHERTMGDLMWNDETPDGKTTSSKAHAKGVMGFDKAGGFYLRHSVPLFPPAAGGKYSYPLSGTTYGQTLLCMSLDITNLDKFAAQFQINNPLIYSANLPAGVNANHIVQLSQGILSNDHSNVANIKLLSGMIVTDFAKSKSWNNDLYAQLVAPTLKKDLQVESWGRPLDPNACPPDVQFSVQNIQDVHLEPYSWHETKDHAKWAISKTSTYTCIGDINRMHSQRSRGGGTTCISNANVHSQFTSLVAQTQPC